MKFNIVINGKIKNANIKWLIVERSGVKFGTRGVLVEYIWDKFDLVMFEVILG